MYGISLLFSFNEHLYTFRKEEQAIFRAGVDIETSKIVRPKRMRGDKEKEKEKAAKKARAQKEKRCAKAVDALNKYVCSEHICMTLVYVW